MNMHVNTIRIPLVIALFFAWSCSQPASQKEENEEKIVSLIDFPEDMMAVVDSKCISCHSPGSSNEKAKDHLIWENLPPMKKLDLVRKVYDIQAVLEKDEMPPKKYLEDKPHKKLTEEEKQLLMSWTEKSLAAMGH